MTKNLWLMMMGVLLFESQTWAQMPTNADKKYEYHSTETVRRAGTGDLMKRLEKWADGYFSDVASYTIAVDDSTKRFIEIDVTEAMVESYFGVKRVHKDRAVSYHIKFDVDRKEYSYWINDIRYKALEIDHKDRETRHDALLSEIKSAASKSLEEELHHHMQTLIESFMSAAETEIKE